MATAAAVQHEPADVASRHGARVWTRGMLLSLSVQSCTACYGLGAVQIRHRADRESRVCDCVLRGVFRSVLDQYLYRLRLRDDGLSQPSRYCWWPRRGLRQIWSRRGEEFTADFDLLARRTLRPFESRVLKLYYVQGKQWREGCRVMGSNRGLFYHSAYGLASQMGRVFYETEPYGLFPVGDYFAEREMR